MNFEGQWHVFTQAGPLDTSPLTLHHPFNFPKLQGKEKDSENMKEGEPQDGMP